VVVLRKSKPLCRLTCSFISEEKPPIRSHINYGRRQT
jgi:hypothetical protein